MSKNLILIDGHSLAYRSFYGFPPTLTLKNKQPINAVYGFVSLLLKGLELYQPDFVCICFDRREPTFRHTMFPDYKAHRPPAPDEFKTQLPILREILERIEIPTLDLAGYEADDLLGTLSVHAVKAGMHSYIMTGDQDSLQLVSDQITVLMNKKGVSDLFEYTPAAVFDKFQLSPVQIVDYKALKGDTSDNIPGVRGIGDKTAVQLLTEYTTLDGIFSNLDKIKSASVREKLSTGKEMAYISQKLATIDCAAPVQIDITKAHYDPNWPQIFSCFEEYEFHRLVNQYKHKFTALAMPVAAAPPVPEVHYQTITTEAELAALIPTLQQGFALDLETTQLAAKSAQIVGLAIAVTPTQAVYIALNAYICLQAETDSLFTRNAFVLNPLLARLKPVLENPVIPKFTHNGKYEQMVLANYGISLQGLAFDTMLAAYLLLPGERLGLKELAFRQLDIQMTAYEDVVGKGKTQVSIDQIPIETVTRYACADADMTLRLKQKFEPLIEAENMHALFYEIEMPLMSVLATMEMTGVTFDTDYLRMLNNMYQTRLGALTYDIHEMAGYTFNINSTQQLAELLFTRLGLPVIRKTKTGVSTDAAVLEKLAPLHPIAAKLSEYRMLEKLLNTYIRALPELIHPATGRIHASFNQTITITGRLSSSNPNLQNIPIRTEEGRAIRRAVTGSKPENKILSADYSQIELRIMAALAEDAHMLSAFRNNDDIHKNTAAIVFGVPVSEVTKDMRSRAKAVNFGIMYGQTAFTLADQLGIGRKDAQDMIDQYFVNFPNIVAFIKDTLEQARKNHFVKTEFGRIRPLPDILSHDRTLRNFAERTAVNTRIQGTAADIMKMAMIQIDQHMTAAKYKSRMIIQVHDELVFDVVPEEMASLKALVVADMSSVVNLGVPLAVDAEFGQTWQEAG